MLPPPRRASDPFVLAGSTLSKRLVLHLPEQRFLQLMEGVMLVSGLSILWMAWP